MASKVKKTRIKTIQTKKASLHFTFSISFVCYIAIMIFLIGLGINELLIVAMIVLLLFGGRKLPELMKGLGKGIREFNNAKSDIKNKLDESIKDEDEKKA
mgnify:CR=1 FL=1|tara:strand:+ start:12972 stop:13271 length:300 start_codon:yes stop_codon:yes gene_type:complete